MSRLPSGYKELEYIESNGTQYIDTGLKNTTGDSYEIDFKPLVVDETQRYFGGLATSTGIGLGLRNDGNIMTFAGGWIYPAGIKPVVDQKIKVEYRSGYGWYLDNSLIDGDTSSASESQNNILVCSVMYNKQAYYPASIKLYSYKHTDSDGNLLRDLVPCKNSSDEVGVYDLVSGSFFSNAGTGDFIAGPPVGVLVKAKYGAISGRDDRRLPVQYQEVEYLESNGTQYIVTDKKYNTLEEKFEIDIGMYYAQPPADNEYVFGTPTATGRYLNPRIDKNKSTITVVTGGSNATLWVKDVAVPTEQKNDLKFIVNSKNITFIVNEDETSGSTSSSYSTTGAISLFDLGNGSANAFTGRIYYFKLFNKSNVLILDLVPCYRKADDVAGMYDLVSGNFYTNDGTGEFEIGDPLITADKKRYKVMSYVVSSRLPAGYKEVEYLESSGEQYINTEVRATASTGMDIDFAYMEISADANAGVSGIYQGTSPRTDTFFISSISGKTNSNIELFHRGITFNTNVVAQALTKYNVKLNWMNDGKANFNNGTKVTDIGSNAVVAKDIIIFGRLNNANDTYAFSKIRCYGLRFSEGSDTIMDLVPCYRKSDSVIGMYDLVSGYFLTNAGTGVFAKGPDVGTIMPQRYGIINVREGE